MLRTRGCAFTTRNAKYHKIQRNNVPNTRYCHSKPNNSSLPKLTVCLDLNETLVCSNPFPEKPEWFEDDEDITDVAESLPEVQKELEGLSVAFKTVGELRKLTWNHWMQITQEYNSRMDTKGDTFEQVRKNIFRGVPAAPAKVDLLSPPHKIYYRPHLDHFVKEIKEMENVQMYLYTAASKAFADTVTNNFAPDFFTKKLYKDTVHEQGGNKPLSNLGTPIERTILVDNTEKYLKGQEENGILVPDFYGFDFQMENDAALLHVLSVIQAVSGEEDIRPKLKTLNDLYKTEQDGSQYAVRERYYKENIKVVQ